MTKRKRKSWTTVKWTVRPWIVEWTVRCTQTGALMLARCVDGRMEYPGAIPLERRMNELKGD